MNLFYFTLNPHNLWHEKKYLLQFLNENEQKRVLRLYQDKHKVEKLYSLLFLRYILSQYLKISSREISYQFSEKGKPYLSNEKIHFNLSNSHSHIVVVIDHQEVGVDIEEHKDIELDIAERFFSYYETQDIFKSNSPHKRFFEYWTLKEAFLKCVGTGLSKSLNSFTIFQTSTNLYETEENHKKYYLQQSYLSPTLPISLCSPSPILSLYIIKVSQKDVETFFHNTI